MTVNKPKPTDIFILPGLDGTGLLSGHVIAELQDSFAVKTLAYPSELSDYASLCKFAKDHLPDKDYVLVAESFAGPLAALIGAQQPHHLKGIIFVATFLTKPRKLPLFSAGILGLVPLTNPFLVRLAQPFLMGRWSNQEFSDLFRRALSQVPATTIVARLKQVLQVDATGQLAKIKVPMLYLRASKDRLVPARAAQGFAVRGVPIEEVAGPHFLLQANPQGAAVKIAQFVQCLSTET